MQKSCHWQLFLYLFVNSHINFEMKALIERKKPGKLKEESN